MVGRTEFDCRFIGTCPHFRHAIDRIPPHYSHHHRHPFSSRRLRLRTSFTSHDLPHQTYRSNYRWFPWRWFHLQHFPPTPQATNPSQF